MPTCEFVIDDSRNVQYRAEKNTWTFKARSYGDNVLRNLYTSPCTADVVKWRHEQYEFY